MSDTDTTTPDGTLPDGTFSGDERGLRAAAAEHAGQRVLAQFDAENNPPGPPEPEAEPEGVVKAPSDGEAKTSRQAARELHQWHLDQERRAAEYRAGLADPASAWAANAANQAGPDGSDARAVGAIEGERQQLEAERQQLAQEREATQRFAAYGSAEAQWLATEQQLLLAEQQHGAQLQQEVAAFNQLFGDIRTDADVAQMQAADSARFARWQECSGYLRNLAAQVQQTSQQRAQATQQREQLVQQRMTEGTAAFQREAKHHDDWFSAGHPELDKDPTKHREVQAALAERFNELGIVPEEIAAHWHGQKNFSLRDCRVQELLYDAAQWKIAQAKVRAAEANVRNTKTLPPVQRPGVRPERSDRSADIAGLERRFANSTGQRQMRLGVELLAAKRAAGQL